MCGIFSDTVRKLLLREANLTLEKAKELCVKHELADIDTKGINVDPSVQTNSVNSVKARKAKPQPQAQRYKQQVSTIRNCKYCGKSHRERECPAFGKQCPKCQKYNHLPSVCRSAPSGNQAKQQSSSKRKRFRQQTSRQTVEEAASSIPNATVFSILDAKFAFWHIPVDQKSSYYTTFNTVFGRFRYLRMPYGITSGSEVYQQAIEQLLEGLPCKVIVDDVFVYGTNTHDHDQNLKLVLDRIRQINLSLNN